MKIAILDYDIGNVQSIINAFSKFSVDTILTRSKSEILDSDGLVIPGVGSYSIGMENLRKYSLDKIIYKYVDLNKPILGICLGMQVLMDESEEFGYTKGLGLIKGKVDKIKIKDKNNFKLPHIGWSNLFNTKKHWDNTILEGINKNDFFYFVHSYCVQPSNPENILSETSYSNYNFCSVLKKNNIYGTQFHPEKSSTKGLEIIENYINICLSNRKK